jgi:cobalamin biosynthesis protein CobD/CbiB
MPEENIPEIKKEEDKPNSGITPKKSIEEITARTEAAIKGAKAQHDLSKDTWVTIAGLILILILLTGSGVISWISSEKPYVTSFLNLLSSSIMLIMGYIFGTRNNQ